jgi:flagellar hook-associated protein 1 FlgK
MAKIHAMMDIGKRSMMNSQTSLQTTAHNIANKTTEGYSRQRVETVTAPPVQEGRLQLGMGSRAALVTRVNSPFLEKQIQKETGQMGYLDGQADAMSRVEQVFNEQANNKGLNQYISDFFNSFRELSNNPESTTTRTMVKESADSMAQDFRRVDKQLSDIQKDIDLQIKAGVQEINNMTREIAALNSQIHQTEMQGIPANDQRDRRDLLLKRLNEKVDIKVAEGDRGMVTVQTAGNALLVSGLDSTNLETYHDPSDDRVRIYARPSESHPPFEITSRIKGGSIGGVLHVRDVVIDDIRSNIDQIAFAISKEVNDAHLQGFDRNGKQAGFFFNPLSEVGGAAKKIALSSEVADDVTRIATAAKTGAPGDATISNVISMIQYNKVLDGGTASIDDFYNGQVGRIGVMAQTANKTREAQGNILQQANALRESIAGVSLDEEATKMIEFQKTFDASARLIRTADEMFDTVLNLKRM